VGTLHLVSHLIVDFAFLYLLFTSQHKTLAAVHNQSLNTNHCHLYTMLFNICSCVQLWTDISRFFYISKDFFTQQQPRQRPRDIIFKYCTQHSYDIGGGQEQKDILGLNKSVTQKKTERDIYKCAAGPRFFWKHNLGAFVSAPIFCLDDTLLCILM
jgi:hypothetical protein